MCLVFLSCKKKFSHEHGNGGAVVFRRHQINYTAKTNYINIFYKGRYKNYGTKTNHKNYCRN